MFDASRPTCFKLSVVFQFFPQLNGALQGNRGEVVAFQVYGFEGRQPQG